MAELGAVLSPRQELARSRGARERRSTAIASADHGGARRSVIVPWLCEEMVGGMTGRGKEMGGVLDRERRGWAASWTGRGSQIRGQPPPFLRQISWWREEMVGGVRCGGGLGTLRRR
jgi:hypothetical protein